MKHYSAQRAIILDVLSNTKAHPSADMIYEMCRKQNKKIGKATIYRNLEELVKEKRVAKVSCDFKEDRFDGDISVHNHKVCRFCGKIEDAPCSTKMLKLISEEINNNSYESVGLTFYKTCNNCKAKLSEEVVKNG